MSKTVLITGAAGFIGFHLSKKLLDKGFDIHGVDNLNDYYDPKLKKDRLKQLKKYNNFFFYEEDIQDKEFMERLFKDNSFDIVVNLAAQAGVRYSLINPYSYVDTNITGFLNVLEGCRHSKVKHLIYASSSSVYGLNTNMPFKEENGVNHPISIYAATKKANEMMAHSYSHLFNIPTTGLRFFTVYGPWGRPDMALFLFTDAIINDKPIDVFNYGNMMRDFTYVDDIVEGIYRLLDKAPEGSKEWDSDNPDPSISSAPFRIFNIGNNSPVKLMDYIEAIEYHLGKKAKKNLLPLQDGDVPGTFADASNLQIVTGFKPETTVSDGVGNFIRWYKNYYDVK